MRQGVMSNVYYGLAVIGCISLIKIRGSWMWWAMPVILALEAEAEGL
jgi:hypothetical protein